MCIRRLEGKAGRPPRDPRVRDVLVELHRRQPRLRWTPLVRGHLSRAYGEVMNDSVRLSYRVLTGPDDPKFCERVTQALRDGYELYGSPAATFEGERVTVSYTHLRAHETVLD